jgi:cytochrome P450
MAILEATLLLGTLLRRYKLQVVKPRSVKYGITVTLPIAGGLAVTAVPRAAADARTAPAATS